VDHEVTIFEQALARCSSPEREAYLREACAGDAVMFERLQSLLRAHDLAGGFLEHRSTPAAESGADGIREDKPVLPKPSAEQGGTGIDVPSKIGRYKILQQIGEGGCGVVYMAEQQEPVRRRVALKIIKPGMDTRQVIARFEAERQALALMDHPNIARILDGGVTEAGRPFFVMDLVQGLPITQFCDEARLPTRARLALFLEVCSAIQHAHQKGVIHRDLKPSNILVTLRPDGSGLPKIIDFGIAKATQQPLTDKTLFTQFQQLIGTPAYMSPEQATLTGFDIDTRSDIYSLGVLLYELLTGKTPFDSKELLKAGVDELRRTIREKEPPRPSTRVSTLPGDELTTTAQRRGVEASKLVSVLRGDLDWIVMKCLEKDRTRRYETANGLAMDIQRHLNNEPVLASPPSALYRFQKLARRHKLAFAAGVGIAAALGLGIVASTFWAVRAHRAEGRTRQALANEEKQKAAAQGFLYSSLVDQAHAVRLIRQVGYRERVFALLKQAGALEVPVKNLADLRQEAVAAMGDFVGPTPVSLTNFHTNIWSASMDAAGKLAAFYMEDGTIELRQLPSGSEIARLTPTNETVAWCFPNSKGDRLFLLSATNSPPFSWRVRVLSPDTNGRWVETETRKLPQIVAGALRTWTGSFAVIVTPVNKGTNWYQTVDWKWDWDAAGALGAILWPHDPQDHEAVFARIRLLDLESGAFVPGFEVTNAVPPHGFVAFAASADAPTLVVETETRAETQTLDGAEMKLYNWKTGELIRELPRTMGKFLTIRPDGKRIVCLSSNNFIKFYTLPKGQPGAEYLRGFTPCFSRNTFAMDEWQQHRIRLHNFLSGEDVADLDEPDYARPVAFTADGNGLLTHGHRHARLYRRNSREKLDLPAHGTEVTCIAFSPDGRCLATVDQNKVLQVSDPLTGTTLWETNDLVGCCVRLDYSSDGQWLATGGSGTGLVSIRDAQTGRRLLEVGTNADPGGIPVQFSPDRRYLATAEGPGGGVKIWTIQDTNGLLEAKLFRSWPSGATVQFAPDSRSLAFGGIITNKDSEGWAHYVWDFLGSAHPRPVNIRHASGPRGMSFTPDSRHLIAAGDDGMIVRVDLASGQGISSFRTDDQGGIVEILRLSPDGSKLALPAISNRGVEIRDPATGKLLYWLPEETGKVFWLAWSPDSRRLAIARGSGNVAIWNFDAVEQTLAEVGLRQ
jgi:serine/threonine protein kinase/WD40 repeat protein